MHKNRQVNLEVNNNRRYEDEKLGISFGVGENTQEQTIDIKLDNIMSE